MSGQAVRDVYGDDKEGGGYNAALRDSFPDLDRIAQAAIQSDSRGSVAQGAPDPAEHSASDSCCQ